MIEPYGNNILFKPKVKDKVIGQGKDNKYLYGEVLAVGEDVKKIKKGDTIYHTKWGTWMVVKADGTEDWYIPDDPYFILGVEK